MNIGDIVIPTVNRFPATDSQGMHLDCNDDLLNSPTIVMNVGRCVIEVRSVETGKIWNYRGDEVRFFCTREEWRARTRELLAA